MARPQRLTTFFLALGGAVAAHALLLTLPMPGSTPTNEPPETLHIHLAARAGTDHASTAQPSPANEPSAKVSRRPTELPETRTAVTPPKAPITPRMHPHPSTPARPPRPVIARHPALPTPRNTPRPDSEPKRPEAESPKAATPPTASLATAGSTPAPDVNAKTTLDPATQRQLSDAFRARLSAYLARFRHYPLLARREGQTGIVKLHFVMDRQGQVLSRNLTQSTPFPLLNREALALLDRAIPLPKPPTALKGRQFDYTLPITFEIH